jgi:hypothetical protein
MAAEANLSLLRQHAAVILAQQSAKRAVKRRLQAEGRIKLWSLSAAHISRLANEHLRAHPELLERAAERAAELFGQARICLSILAYM